MLMMSSCYAVFISISSNNQATGFKNNNIEVVLPFLLRISLKIHLKNNIDNEWRNYLFEFENERKKKPFFISW